jgi:bifunctional ADP-heptose synthase (sugar kinase/adenylyltransferase)
MFHGRCAVSSSVSATAICQIVLHGTKVLIPSEISAAKGAVKKGMTFGSFDLFLTGHVLMMQEAKTVCDHLTL